MGNQPAAATALTSIEEILDRFDASVVPSGQRLASVQLARRLASRLTAAAALLLAQADAAGESLRATGTPTTTWLALQGGLSKREAAGALHQARELTQRREVGAAAASGRISVNQARAIGGVLDGLGLDAPQQARAEQVMLSMASSMDADRLAKAAPQVLAEVAAERATETQERRLQRQAEAARRNRSLRFVRDLNGSVAFTGSLPVADAEGWIAIIDAYVESRRRNAVEERDPLATTLTPDQRRADALLAMIRAHQAERQAPGTGGDRPRVVVTLDYDRLRADAAGAGLIGPDEQLSAGDLRRLCCDADLVPAVLGAASEVLDVGRASRLVTPAIRAALTLRDGGCVFPGCETRPTACEAHHIRPWWAGGETALANLALLCHHHHALVEPARYAVRDQWELRIAGDGLPEAVPPRRYDPERRPRRHARLGPPGTDGQARSGAPPGTDTTPEAVVSSGASGPSGVATSVA